jgi:nucleotide-binding universal stress UspA family protein
VSLASAVGAEVHVVSAFVPLRGLRIEGRPEDTANLQATLPDMAVERTHSEAATTVRQAGVDVVTHAIRGNAADALLSVAEDVGASTIIVGSRGMHGARRLLGSIPNGVAHAARCNVLIVYTD